MPATTGRKSWIQTCLGPLCSQAVSPGPRRRDVVLAAVRPHHRGQLVGNRVGDLRHRGHADRRGVDLVGGLLPAAQEQGGGAGGERTVLGEHRVDQLQSAALPQHGGVHAYRDVETDGAAQVDGEPGRDELRVAGRRLGRVTQQAPDEGATDRPPPRAACHRVRDEQVPVRGEERRLRSDHATTIVG
ncbi:hypothetical protein MPHLEI_25531 [Mycolicibacterium phlei RIVM601174]|nr:hypothetical protein MPHLEI_25531 [Mycolicibacterium phlei RIVM601174]MBF4194838.1 hypothetical protein [Mycolicibacterium phlei]